MRVELFDFHLPPARIAHHPVSPRDAAKLLHITPDAMHDRIVRDLPELLNPGDVLVFNNSRVIPARLFAEVNGRQIEVLLHRRMSASDGAEPPPLGGRSPARAGGGSFLHAVSKPPPDAVASTSPLKGEVWLWHAFAKPARKLKAGMALQFAPDFVATVEGRTEDGQVVLRFHDTPEVVMNKLRAHGHMPLPPYITRADAAEDAQDYQTIYAARDGSVAAPTAGLHFTPELMVALSARGVATAFVTLHVGAGTFQPVKVGDTDAHVMHREWIELGAEAANIINTARAAGGKVIAVGTTSLRVLESAAEEIPSLLGGGLGWGRGEAGSLPNSGPLPTSHLRGEGFYALQPYFGETGIFITPGYRFKIVDRLMTNFHLPKSTLFMLVSAFAGLERMQAAYQHAIASDYRFYSYGDTSLLERAS